MVIIDLVFGKFTDGDFILQFGVFALAIFCGYLVVWNVSAALHTPLMSVTNAISGIIVVGCMVSMLQHDKTTFFVDYSIMAFVGLVFASINIVGGFVVTHRMLTMFRK